MKRKYVHIKKLCECGCGEEIGLRRSDQIKNAKFKKYHKKNKREILFIDKPCKCGCGEIIGKWKFRPERNIPEFKHGHFKKNTAKEKRINNQGYVLIYKPDYENTYKGGYILEHRYIMENYLGRKLLSTEDIHHLNGNKQDNKIENLQVVDHLEHTLIHASERAKNFRKIKDEDIPKIKELRKKGTFLKDIAKIYNVTPSTILNNLKR